MNGLAVHAHFVDVGVVGQEQGPVDRIEGQAADLFDLHLLKVYLDHLRALRGDPEDPSRRGIQDRQDPLVVHGESRAPKHAHGPEGPAVGVGLSRRRQLIELLTTCVCDEERLSIRVVDDSCGCRDLGWQGELTGWEAPGCHSEDPLVRRVCDLEICAVEHDRDRNEVAEGSGRERSLDRTAGADSIDGGVDGVRDAQVAFWPEGEARGRSEPCGKTQELHRQASWRHREDPLVRRVCDLEVCAVEHDRDRNEVAEGSGRKRSLDRSAGADSIDGGVGCVGDAQVAFGAEGETRG